MTVEKSFNPALDSGQAGALPTAIVASLLMLAALLYFAVAVHILLTGHLHEDAYILFTYVEHLAQGDGFAFYAGAAPTEGATDFLWTVALAAFYRLGIDPGVMAAALNAFGIFVLCRIAITFIPAELTVRMRLALAICATAIVVVSPIASAGLCGFSAPIFAAVAALLFTSFLGKRYHLMLWGGLLLGLIRTDGIIIGGGYALLGLAELWRQDGRRRYLIQMALAAAVGGAYFAWRLYYFGYLLPLPLYVKSTDVTAFAGVAANLDWLTVTLPLVALAITVVLHDTVDRRRLGLAVLPLLLLLISLSFARQWQNIDFRFQAPATAVAIVIATMSAGHWIRRVKSPVVSVATVGCLAICLPIFRTVFVFNVRYLESVLYDNALPYHLAAATSRETTIALTEAGRMAYWANGRKIDLVGLNTPYPAIHGLDLAYLERL